MRRLTPLFSIFCLTVAASCLFAVWAHDATCVAQACMRVRFAPGWLQLIGGLLAFVAGMLLMVDPTSPEAEPPLGPCDRPGCKGHGVIGNENIIDGIKTCDYCHVDLMDARQEAPVAESPPAAELDMTLDAVMRRWQETLDTGHLHPATAADIRVMLDAIAASRALLRRVVAWWDAGLPMHRKTFDLMQDVRRATLAEPKES